MLMKNEAPLSQRKVDYSRELVADSVMQTSNGKVESSPSRCKKPIVKAPDNLSLKGFRSVSAHYPEIIVVSVRQTES